MKNKLLLTLLSLGMSGAAFASTITPPAPTAEVEKPKVERKCNPENAEKQKCGPKYGKHRGEHAKKFGKLWEHTDTNKDGKISREEALNAAGEKFDKSDVNKDGFITKEEMKELHKNMKKKAPKGPRGEGKHIKKDAPVAPATTEAASETK